MPTNTARDTNTNSEPSSKDNNWILDYLAASTSIYRGSLYTKSKDNPKLYEYFINAGYRAPYKFYRQSWEDQVKQWKGGIASADGLMWKYDYAKYFSPTEPLVPYIMYGKWYDPIFDENRYKECTKIIWKYELNPIHRFHMWNTSSIWSTRVNIYKLNEYPEPDIDYSQYRIPPVEFYKLRWEEQVQQWNEIYSKEDGYIQVLFSTSDPMAQFRKRIKVIPSEEYYKHEYKTPYIIYTRREVDQ
jgi:hypothetical protein